MPDDPNLLTRIARSIGDTYTNLSQGRNYYGQPMFPPGTRASAVNIPGGPIGEVGALGVLPRAGMEAAEIPAARTVGLAANPATTETTATMIGSTPVSSSNRFMGQEEIKQIEGNKFFVPYTNPAAKPGSGMNFSLAETQGSNGATRFNVYRSAINPEQIKTSQPDASAFVRNGKIESVYVDPDWRGKGLFGQMMRELGSRGLNISEQSPKSASLLAAEAKMAAKSPPNSK